MIDTIKASIDISKEGKTLAVLENQRTIINPQTKDKRVVGKIKNISFHIFYKPDNKIFRVSFIGSLNKFIHDNNYTPSTISDVEKAIKTLSGMTGLPLHKATVKRVDIGACIAMKFPVTSYLLLLEGKAGRYKKTNIADETIYFFNRSRCFAFYDKTKESKKKGKEIIPSAFANKYVLRYELRYYRALAEQFSMEKVILSDLYDKRFYELLKKKWIKGYFEVIKHRIQHLNKVKDLKSLSAFLILNGVEKVGGFSKVMSMIDTLCLKRKIIPGSKYRLKKRIRELFLQKATSKIAREVKELNRKVKRIYNYNLKSFQ